MILSCSWIYLPFLSSSVIIRFFPRLCFLLTFFQLVLLFHPSCASGYLPSLSLLWSYISPLILYFLWSLRALFSIISLRFFIRALVGDDIFGFFGFLVCVALLKVLCWIISVMFLFRLFMSSCSSNTVNLFFSSS